MSLLSAFIVPHPPLIVPAVGKGEEQKINKTIEAYEAVARRIEKMRPETIVLISPHSILYADYIHISPGTGAEGDLSQFRAPAERCTVKYDQTLSAAIASIAGREGISAGGLGEKTRRLDHGTMVPLHFVNQQYHDYELVRISVSGLSPLDHYRFGKCLAEAIQNSKKRVVLIASGDLSHKLTSDGPYGFATEGPAFDKAITEAMASADFG
ncbi:MAG: AmmeMemoRadiSam system protein B, partial [Bacillota bacterium]|nr:AmmeMemoRadiSam system protein B [Bacillota bacterium]